MTVYAKMTTISMCEATTGWATTGTGTLALADNTIFDPIQGTYNLQDYRASSGSRGADYDLGAGGTNLTGQAIYCWFAFNRTSILQVKGSTGLRIRVTDTSGNYSEWDIAGSDTLPHAGWIAYCVELASTPSRTSGTLNKSLVRYVGYKADTVAAKGYIYFDAWRYGTGLTLTGGSSGSPVSLASLTAADTPNPSGNTNAYGVISLLNGIYFAQGQINVGYETGATTETTYFKNLNDTLVFKALTTVTDTFYRFNAQGTATYTTEIYLGEKSGTQGISGCSIISQSSSYRYTIDFSDTDVTKFGLYGCTFSKASTITLPAYNANKEVLNCIFSVCAKLVPSTSTMTNCTFISSTAKAMQMNSTSCVTYQTKLTFIGCQTAIEISTAGTYDPFTDIYMAGNTYDIENSTAGAVIINEAGTSNISTGKLNNSGGGTTTVNLNVSLYVYIKDSGGTKVQDVQVSIETTSDALLAKAFAYRSGPTYTDETTAANNATANDMNLLYSSPTVNDAYYFGSNNTFKRLWLNIGTAGVGTWTIVWEYYNGSTWTELTLATNQFYDGTSQFKNSGNCYVSFTIPSDWAQNAVNSVTLYWLRARLSAYTSKTTAPLGTQAGMILVIANTTTDATYGRITGSFNYGYYSTTSVWVKARKSSAAPKYIPVKTAGSIESTGLNATVSMASDAITT